MSWNNVSKRMHDNPTDGSEFNNGKIVEGNPKISRTNCDYCNCEVLCIWDDYNRENWYPYLGNQSRKVSSYRYSPIINKMREYYECSNATWDEEHHNNLMNLHARAHSEPNDWSKRAHPNGMKILCNKCFQKTYKRIKVLGENGILYSLSVLEERGETIESVMKDLDIKGTVVGKGAINNYS